ncbi:MAG: SMC-Scp complex subunit ScpB [bacterium]
MNQLEAKIEAILFLSTRPVSFTKMAKMLGVKEAEARDAVDKLAESRNTTESGISVIVGDSAAELGSNPDFADITQKMSKEETEAELTRPQLETLTIVAYRSPITKAEIEHIRGVNCSIILRNLLMRGLIIEKEDKDRLQPIYSLSTEMLRHLGVSKTIDLPDFDKFNKNEKIDGMLASGVEEPSP